MKISSSFVRWHDAGSSLFNYRNFEQRECSSFWFFMRIDETKDKEGGRVRPRLILNSYSSGNKRYGTRGYLSEDRPLTYRIPT